MKILEAVKRLNSVASFAEKIILYSGLSIAGLIGIIASYLASFSAVIAPFGGIAYLAIGLCSTLLTTLIALIASSAYLRIARAKGTILHSERPHHVNPLLDTFDRQVVSISDFYSAGAMVYKDRVFKNCRIQGPGTIYLANRITMERCSGDFAVIETVNEFIPSNTIVIFENSMFRDCVFVQVSCLGPPGFYQTIMGGNAPGHSVPGPTSPPPTSPGSGPNAAPGNSIKA